MAAVWGKTAVEVKVGVHALRNIRDGLLQLAYSLAGRPDLKGLLILLDSKVSQKRLTREREVVQRVLHPDIAGRLEVISVDEEDIDAVSARFEPGFRDWLVGQVRSASIGGHVPRGVPIEVMKVLLHQWLLGKGPVQSGWLARTVGCSYPTVATALKRLDRYVRRASDRRVELESFPREEWARLLVNADRLRSTLRYADRSGKPRTPDALRARLERLKRPDVGVGGVEGARHYHPAIDLAGTARLELTWHRPRGAARPDFVAALDPALAPVSGHGEPSTLVVHILRRAEPLFQAGSSGVPWADPVECLLDLQEARLVDQAEDFIASLRRSPAEHP